MLKKRYRFYIKKKKPLTEEEKRIFEEGAKRARAGRRLMELLNEEERRIYQRSSPTSIHRLNIGPDEIKKRVTNFKKTIRKSINKKEIAKCVSPVYEGILSAILKRDEAYKIFEASIYMLIELTKHHDLHITRLGRLGSYMSPVKSKFRWRFIMKAAKEFKSMGEDKNLFELFYPRVTKLNEKVLDKNGDVIVDFRKILDQFKEKKKLSSSKTKDTNTNQTNTKQ